MWKIQGHGEAILHKYRCRGKIPFIFRKGAGNSEYQDSIISLNLESTAKMWSAPRQAGKASVATRESQSRESL